MSRVVPTPRELEKIIAVGCGIDANGTDVAMRKRLSYYSVRALIAANPLGPRPSEIETNLQLVINSVRDLRRAVGNLDEFTRGAVRRSADKAQLTALEELTAAAKANDEAAIEAAHEKLEATMKRPRNEWIDIALLQSLDDFEGALIEQAENAISVAPTGAGRPKNLAAYRLAEVAVRAHLEFTGRKPTFWNGGGTPFSRMMDALFAANGVRAATRKPYEAAMHKLCPN